MNVSNNASTGAANVASNTASNAASILEKPFIIGASGLVGGALYAACKRRHMGVVGTYATHKQDDLIKFQFGNFSSDEECMELLEQVSPTCIFVASAMTNADQCELNEKDVMFYNVTALRPVIEYAKKHKILLVYFSTDYVFDGKDGPYDESAHRNPINVYGRSKMSMEDTILAAELSKSLIVRITNVFDIGFDQKNFLYRVVTTLRDKKELRVPNDQIATPIWATDLANILLDLIEHQFSKVLHKRIINISCDDCISRYEFAMNVAKRIGADENLVVGVSTVDLKQSAARPLNGGLRNDAIKNMLHIEKISFNHALDEIMPKILALYHHKI